MFEFLTQNLESGCFEERLKIKMGMNQRKFSGNDIYRNENNDCVHEPASNTYQNTAATNNFHNLPPPLEPRECIIPCIDPITAELAVIPNWWRLKMLEQENNRALAGVGRYVDGSLQRDTNYGSTNGLYVMPSSMAPIHSSTFIPPPTPYRDESGNKNVYRWSSYDKGRSYNNSYRTSECDISDIIEIKRPVTVCLHRKESDNGLVYACDPNSPCFSQMSGQLHNDSGSVCHQGSHHLRNGLFNLPDVYSPPPLAERNNAVQTTGPLQGVMPSFYKIAEATNKFNSQKMQTPRLAFSEPILKSQTEKLPLRPNDVRPETNHISPRLKNKTFIVSASSKCNDVKSTREIPESSVPGQKSIYTDCHTFNQRGLKNIENGGTEDDKISTVLKHNGSGDSNEHTMVDKTSIFSNHNCLSPRARVSCLQSSVITSEMTESLLNDCLLSLKSSHWEDNFEAFSQIYNLTEIHPNRVKSILSKVIWYGFPHLSSPRTKLARMACICFKRLYQTQKRSMETEGERIFYRLLDLCGGLANNFIQQESREALVAAVENMDPLKSLSFLELHGAKHKNPHVREFSAYLLSTIMDELPQHKLMNKEFSPRVIPMIVSFLREGLLQTRLHAKLALDKIFDHSTFECKLRRYVSPENIRHITDTLREFRERRSGHL